MMASSPVQHLLGEMKRRRVGRTLITYGVAVFAVLQGAQPVFEGLLLPDFAFRVLVVLAMAGFPAVFVLAWVYELTADGVRKTKSRPASGPKRRVPLRRWLQIVGIFVLASTVAAATAAGLGRMRFPASSDDGRVGVAVFPFRTTANAQDSWSEGAADLLSTALDGTAGLRIVDPWSLWRPLRGERDAPAGPPDVETATRLAHEAGAHRFVLGAVVAAGRRVDVTLRLYQVGRVDPLTSFVVTGAPDSMVAVVRDAAVRVMARIWGPRRPSGL
ncbi:MAG: hypothetical protein PVH00_00280, partial [Gemmatimonadota bacterium]